MVNDTLINVSVVYAHTDGTWFTSDCAVPNGATLADAVRVVFDLDYEFSNKLFALAIGPVFNMIAQTFMDGFVKQAKVLYGQ